MLKSLITWNGGSKRTHKKKPNEDIKIRSGVVEQAIDSNNDKEKDLAVFYCV